MENKTENTHLIDAELFQEFQAVLDEMTDISKVSSAEAKRILLAHCIDKVMNLGNVAISQIKQLKDEAKALKETLLKSQELLKETGKNRSYDVVILKEPKINADNNPHLCYKPMYISIQAKSEDNLLENCYEKYGRNIYVLPLRCKDIATGIWLFDNTSLVDEFLKNVLVPNIELDEVDRKNLAECGTLTPTEIPDTDADVEELVKQINKEGDSDLGGNECSAGELLKESDTDDYQPVAPENITAEEFAAAGLIPPQQFSRNKKRSNPVSEK